MTLKRDQSLVFLLKNEDLELFLRKKIGTLKAIFMEDKMKVVVT
jgi:hypothetical protein